MKQIKVKGLGLQTNNFCPANLKKSFYKEHQNVLLT